jgi:hypothetical protein
LSNEIIQSPLEKRENENEYDYHKRLIYGKLKDKTLSDYDYSELAPYVYGQDYSVDVARRMMYGSCRTLEKLEEQVESDITDSKVLSKIEAEKIELQKERQRFYDQRREYNKIVTEIGRQDRLFESLAESASKLSDSIGCIFNNHLYENIDFGDNEAVLVLSDWHYGLVADNVYNRYNTEICLDRVKKVIDDAIRRIVLHKCNTLHVVLLADFIHGAIHCSARVASEELVADQLMNVSEIIAQCLLELSGYVNEVNVYSTYGNHGRVVPNKQDSIHRDNFERIIPWWLEQRISAEESRIGKKLNIKFAPDTGSEFLFLSPCGIDMCASHGDLDNVKSSPQLLSTLFHKLYGKDIQAILLGDKHHGESFEEMGITSMICGSLCGSDDYANGKRLYSTPSQLLLIVNPVDGIDAEYRLKC